MELGVHRRVDGVVLVGPVEGQRDHVVGLFVEQRLVAHRSLAHVGRNAPLAWLPIQSRG